MPQERDPIRASLDAVIVGAGFAGMYQLHRLRRLGMTAIVFEAATDVGGTWWYNRYPGARCDVESMQYSFSFDADLQQEWRWSERFAGQPEILRYAQHVAERFDLRRDIRFATRVETAHWDEAAGLWHVATDRGDAVRARFCIMATGCLSAARMPEIAGRDDFAGRTFHTGAWPHAGVDFAGRRVAVIGTGSSAIQAIPVIAEQAAQLTVFQRTPNFSIPSRNAPMDAEYEQSWKSAYPEKRATARTMRNGILYNLSDKSAMEVDEATRRAEYEKRWEGGGIAFMAAFMDLALNQDSNDTAADFVRERIAEIVKDPETAENLSPRGYPIGTKRICVDTDYFATYNKPHVRLINIKQRPIEAIVAAGVRLADETVAVDDIVFATGFDAMTGALNAIDIAGEGGVRLRDKWAAGPRTYLGLMSAGFPNLFMITAPGSPSVLSNMIVSIEQHVDWISDCLAHLRARGLDRIEPTPAAEEAWVAEVNEVAHRTLYPKAASWYMGANVPGKPRIFMPYIGGVGVYRGICDEVAAEGYRGFALGAPASARVAAE